jgi:hypothetical protein
MDDETAHAEHPESEASTPQPLAARPGSPWVAGERLIAIFLLATALGFIGTLIGFVPLIALAMIIPVAAAAIA